MAGYRRPRRAQPPLRPVRVRPERAASVPPLSAELRECLASAVDGGIVAAREYAPAAALYDLGLLGVSFLSPDEYRFSATPEGRRVAAALATVTRAA
jgi:hypothetical protein